MKLQLYRRFQEPPLRWRWMRWRFLQQSSPKAAPGEVITAHN
jgi:hypothetical protein